MSSRVCRSRLPTSSKWAWSMCSFLSLSLSVLVLIMTIKMFVCYMDFDGFARIRSSPQFMFPCANCKQYLMFKNQFHIDPSCKFSKWDEQGDLENVRFSASNPSGLCFHAAARGLWTPGRSLASKLSWGGWAAAALSMAPLEPRRRS